MKNYLILILLLFSSNAFCENPWNEPKEAWNILSEFRINKEDARAFFVPHFTSAEASKVLDIDGVDGIYNTQSAKLLNGEWKFFWAQNPSDKSPEFFKKSFDDSKWKTIDLPNSWQAYGYDTIFYNNITLEMFFNKDGRWLSGFHKGKNEEMAAATRNPFVPEMHRQSAVYRRAFTLPQNWDGKEIFVRFNGVRTGFKLYVNGQYAGYSEDSFTPAEFDISKYLLKGENSIAVEVFKFTTGAYFEMQDMPHMMGIIRDVVLLARPKLYIRDYYAPQKISDDLKTAEINFELSLKNLNKKAVQGGKIKAFLIDNSDASSRELFTKKAPSINASSELKISENITFKNFKLWSPDKPNLYTLVFELSDAQGKILEAISADYAFRKFEIKGKTLFLNNKRFLIKGANRHDWSPDKGKAVDFVWMKKDAELMARANINAVRTSHYPNDDKFLMLCSRYGLTVMDENNFETHGLREEIPTNHEWFVDAALDRMKNMVMRDRNVPSVVMWSLGNENGLFFNKSHQAMFDFTRKADPARPIHSEPEMRDPATLKNQKLASPTDFVSGMYGGLGRIKWYQTQMQNETRPFIFCEYMHSMGNSTGNLKEIWDEFRKDPSLNGGYLWDWVDQSFYMTRPDKPEEKFLSDGRDWGTKPSSETFCLNGIIFADRTYSPKYLEVKRVHQNLQFTVDAEDISKLKIKNEFFDTNTNEFDAILTIQKNGETISETKLPAIDIAPSQEGEIKLDLPKELNLSDEYFYTLSFVAKNDLHFASKGEALAVFQQLISGYSFPKLKIAGDTTTVFTQNNANIFVSTSTKDAKAEYVFDKKSATLVSLKVNGKNVITRPLEFDISQAWIENLRAQKRDAQKYGLENLEEKNVSFEITNKNIITFSKDLVNGDGDGFRITSTYNFWNGYCSLATRVEKLNDTPERLELPRLGIRMGIAKALENVQYYGRGPMGNFNDRATCADLGIYSDKVKNFLENYPCLQDSGNREDVRWMALTDNEGAGALFLSRTNPLPYAVLPNTQAEMKKYKHPYELSQNSDSELRIAWKVSGVGNGSHGPETLDQYRVHFKGIAEWSFKILPLAKGGNAKDVVDKSVLFGNIHSLIPQENTKVEGLAREPKGKWISENAPTEYSSIDEKWSPKKDTLTSTAEGIFAFHTKDENKPYVIIDLKKISQIGEIEILNRADHNSFRTTPLAIYISDDKKKWQKVWTSESAKKRWLVEFDKALSARYVKIQLEKQSIFHLKGVKIFAPIK